MSPPVVEDLEIYINLDELVDKEKRNSPSEAEKKEAPAGN